nr:exopolysaccharide production repressor protein [Rhizobium sp. AQ_MP]
MTGALIAFAIGTYMLTGSIGTTIWQTAVSAVLLQLGYFIGVLVLVYRSARDKAKEASGGDGVKSENTDAKSAAVRVAPLNAPERPHP